MKPRKDETFDMMLERLWHAYRRLFERFGRLETGYVARCFRRGSTGRRLRPIGALKEWRAAETGEAEAAE